jgi:hypothetical protein
MTNYSLRFSAAVGALVAVAGIGSAVVTGCTGDDSQAGSPDGSSDATTDQSQDRGPTIDTGVPDATDATTDSPADGGSDAPKDSPLDAPVDAPVDAPALVDFPHAIDVAFCTRVTECCLQTPQTFDVQKCISLYDNAGTIVGLGRYAASLDGGQVAYDRQQAAQCLADFKNVACGTLQAAQFRTFVATCYAAATGTVPLNGGCISSLECASGEYCNVPDGGVGSCASLLTQDAGCAHANGDECSYLGNGSPALNCDPISNACEPRKDLDAGCNNNRQCLSGFCLTKCVNSTVVSDPGVPNGFCDFLTIKDAGGGG